MLMGNWLTSAFTKCYSWRTPERHQQSEASTMPPSPRPFQWLISLTPLSLVLSTTDRFCLEKATRYGHCLHWVLLFLFKTHCLCLHRKSWPTPSMPFQLLARLALASTHYLKTSLKESRKWWWQYLPAWWHGITFQVWAKALSSSSNRNELIASPPQTHLLHLPPMWPWSNSYSSVVVR